ncbi:dUTP diphosphatase [Patescibacteria group bacterium]
MEPIKIKVKKLDASAKLPEYGYEGDAGMDLRTIETVTMQPHERHVFKTGIACEIPEGYVGLVWDKGGLAAKSGITCMAGVIDSNYRGEFLIVLRNTSDEAYVFEKGDKIAQLLIQKVENATIEEIEDLTDSDRGEGKFGSSGK